MASKTHVEPGKVYDYYLSQLPRLTQTMLVIAENEKTDTVVYITDDGGYPQIVVMMEGDTVYEVTCADRFDTEETADDIYNSYLRDDAVKPDDDDIDDDDDLKIKEQYIEDHESELDDAVYDFVHVALDGDIDLTVPTEDEKKVIADLKEHFLSYMATKWKLPVFRPMILEDDDGNEFYDEFPYEIMDDPE